MSSYNIKIIMLGAKHQMLIFWGKRQIMKHILKTTLCRKWYNKSKQGSITDPTEKTDTAHVDRGRVEVGQYRQSSLTPAPQHYHYFGLRIICCAVLCIVGCLGGSMVSTH